MIPVKAFEIASTVALYLRAHKEDEEGEEGEGHEEMEAPAEKEEAAIGGDPQTFTKPTLSNDRDNSFEDTTDYSSAQDALRREIRSGKQKFGFRKKLKTSSGVYRTAIIFDNFIVKYSQNDHLQKDLKSEYDFIAKARSNPKVGKHFPETHIIELDGIVVQVQEKVNMSHKGKNVNYAERFGELLGIDDMHTGNFGWKGPKGREYPVFIDVDIRNGEKVRVPRKARPKKKQDWELMVDANQRR